MRDSFKEWCDPNDVTENLIIERCIEAVERGIDTECVFMSPDIYSAFAKYMANNYPSRMSASANVGLKQMLLFTNVGPVRIVFIPKYKCLLLVGTEYDFRQFEYDVPREFLSDREWSEIDREFERTILGDGD